MVSSVARQDRAGVDAVGDPRGSKMEMASAAMEVGRTGTRGAPMMRDREVPELQTQLPCVCASLDVFAFALVFVCEIVDVRASAGLGVVFEFVSSRLAAFRPKRCPLTSRAASVRRATPSLWRAALLLWLQWLRRRPPHPHRAMAASCKVSSRC